MTDLSTRVALVTGAARGIGAATVRGLAAQGWSVLAVDRCADDPALPYPLGTRDDLDRVVNAAAAGSDPDAVHAIAADTRDATALVDAVAEAERRWGGVAAVSPNGILGDPTRASAAKGEVLLDALAADLVAAVADWRRAR